MPVGICRGLSTRGGLNTNGLSISRISVDSLTIDKHRHVRLDAHGQFREYLALQQVDCRLSVRARKTWPRAGRQLRGEDQTI